LRYQTALHPEKKDYVMLSFIYQALLMLLSFMNKMILVIQFIAL
jgi:hypothetical protein